MKSAAEQLARAVRDLGAALQRLVDESAGPQQSLKLAQAGEVLGFSAKHVRELCLSGDLDSTGEGRNRRVPMSAIKAYQERHRNSRRRRSPSDLSKPEETVTATSGPPTH